jgi:Holliday junction resolvase
MSNFQKKIIAQYKAEGYEVIKLSKTNKNGIADLLIGNKNKAFLLEVKEKNDTIKPLQVYQSKKIANAFGWSFFIIQDGKCFVDYSDMIKETNLF